MNYPNISGPSGASVSAYGAANSLATIKHPLEPNQAGNLGYGLGKLARGAFDRFAEWWNKPSPEQTKNQKVMQIHIQVMRSRINGLVNRLDSDLLKIGRSANDLKALKRIQAIAAEYKEFLESNNSEDFKNLLIEEFEKRKRTILVLQSKSPAATEKLRAILTMLFPNEPKAEEETNLKEKVKLQEKKLNSRRVKMHSRAQKKSPKPLQQIRNAESELKSSFKATEEKKDGKGPLNPYRGAENADNEKSKRPSNNERSQGPTCPVSYNLAIPDPSKYFTLSGPISPTSQIGFVIAGIGDVNGDGIKDFAIADPAATAPGGLVDAGQVWVVFGGPDISSVDLTNLSGSEGFVIYGTQNLGLGSTITRLGDFNNDGIDDFAIGAPAPGLQAFVRIVFGNRSLNSTDFNTCNGHNCFTVNGASIGDGFGSCLAGGEDISGDKIPDLLVGAPFAGGQSGIFYGIFGGRGPWPPLFHLSQLTGPNGFASLGGMFSEGYLGCPIVMGNFQNNPIAGFAVADASDSGTSDIIYVFNGRNGTWPGLLNFTLDGTTAGFSVTGFPDFANPSLIIGGDFDKDGNPDIIVTSGIQGSIYDIYHEPTPLNTPLNLASLNGVNGGNVLNGEFFSQSIALIDINNDGNLDLALGIAEEEPAAYFSF